jgi:hypothetical protein
MPINIMILGTHIVSVYRLFSKMLIVALTLIVYITACDKGGEPKLPAPGKVQMVAHSFADDILAIERGIDAVPESDGIYLVWYSLRDANIGQYNIYRRRDDETFFNRIKIIDLEVESPPRDTTYIDDNADAGLNLNTYYYYFVTASNKDGLEGLAGDTLKYKLLDKPVTRLPDGHEMPVDSLPILKWDFVDIYNLYILRIENSFKQLQYVGVFQSNYDNNSQTLNLEDEEKVPNFPKLQAGTYQWRIDLVGDDEDTSGSESNWKTFTITQN